MVDAVSNSGLGWDVDDDIRLEIRRRLAKRVQLLEYRLARRKARILQEPLVAPPLQLDVVKAEPVKTTNFQPLGEQ
jgi:hypothetical protein